MSYARNAMAIVLPATLACVTSAVGAPPAVGVPWATVRAEARPKPVSARTVLVADGQPTAVIAVPEDPAYTDAAVALRAAVEQRTGVRLRVVPARTLVTGRVCAFVPEVLRPLGQGGRNLILLGDLNSNPAVTRLYIDYYAFEDAAWPGRGGHSVRTVVDPQGLGWNAVVLGGPGPAEVAAAVADYLADLRLEGESFYAEYGLRAVLGESAFLPEIRKRTESCAGQLAGWEKRWLKPDSPEYQQANPGKAACEYVLDLLNVPLVYGGLHYGITGDAAFAQAVGQAMDALYENLDWVEERRTEGYDEHYMVEIWLRAWQQVANSPALTAAQRERGQTVMAFLAGQMAMYRHDLAAYGTTTYRTLSRHEYSGIFAGDAFCRYVQRHCELSGDLAATVAANRANFARVIETMLECYTDGFDHKWGLDANWHLLQQAMEEPRPQYLENGAARLNADYASMCISNAGTFVNFGSENVGHTELYDSWQTVGRAAVLFRDDGAYQWLLDHKLKRHPYKILIMGMNFLGHWYQAAGPAREPTYLAGLNRILVDRLLYEDLVAGRGRIYEGIPLVNQVPRGQTFGKITFRDGLGDEDQYLLLDGLGGVTYSGNDANAIAEYSRFGERLLVQIDTMPDPFYQNLVSVSRGNAGEPTGCFARLLDHADCAELAVVRSEVDPVCGAGHTRTLFMEKGGYCVLVDDVRFRTSGEAYVACTFRSLGEPVLDRAAGTWTVAQPRASLRLESIALPGMMPVPQFATAERSSGATPEQRSVKVMVLRETASRTYEAGETYRFANLFCGIRAGEQPARRAVALQADAVAVCGVRNVVYGVPLDGETTLGPLTVAASAFRLAADTAQFVGLRRLALDGTLCAEFAQPVTLDIDLTKATCQVRSPDLRPAGTVVWAPAWQTDSSFAELANGVAGPDGAALVAELAGLREAVAGILTSIPGTAPSRTAAAVPAGEVPRLSARTLLPPGPELTDARWATLADNREVLVACRADGRLLAVDIGGQALVDVATGKAPLLSVWAGTLDGQTTLLCGAQDGTLLAYDLAAKLLWQERNTHLWYGPQPAIYSLTVADFTGEGGQSIALGTHGGVSLTDSRGRFLRFTQVYAHAVFPVEAVTLYDSPRPWLLANTWGGGLKLVAPAEGVVLDGWAAFWAGTAFYQRLERFGGDETYAVQGGTFGIGCGKLRAEGWSQGQPAAPAWDPASWYKRTDGETRGVLVHDVDGDGLPEVLTGNEAGFLVCYDHTGKLLWKRLVGTAINGLVAVDLNGDGEAEVVVAGDRPGLRVFDRAWHDVGTWSPESGAPVVRLWSIGQAVAAQTADGAAAVVDLGPSR